MSDRCSLQAAISIYEVHAGSGRLRWDAAQTSRSWDELADQLIPYVADMGFTPIELLPVMTHPFGGSWGYQPLGMFAPHAGFGDPDGLRRFVDRSEEHTSELQSLMRISYAVFCLKTNNHTNE